MMKKGFDSRKMQRILALFSAVCVLLAGAALPASAAEAAEAKIAVTVTNGPTTVVIEAVDDAPLPEVTEVEVEDSAEFVLEYTDLGIYEYRISQKAGDEEDVTYDETVYDVTVYAVMEDEQFVTRLVVSVADSEDKLAEISFVNVLPEPEPEPAPEPEPDPIPEPEPTPAPEPESEPSSTPAQEHQQKTHSAKSGVKTGDVSYIPLYAGLIVVALLALTGWIFVRRRKKAK